MSNEKCACHIRLADGTVIALKDSIARDLIETINSKLPNIENGINSCNERVDFFEGELGNVTQSMSTMQEDIGAIYARAESLNIIHFNEWLSVGNSISHMTDGSRDNAPLYIKIGMYIQMVDGEQILTSIECPMILSFKHYDYEVTENSCTRAKYFNIDYSGVICARWTDITTGARLRVMIYKESFSRKIKYTIGFEDVKGNVDHIQIMNIAEFYK